MLLLLPSNSLTFHFDGQVSATVAWRRTVNPNCAIAATG